MLEITQVSRSFGATKALQDVSLNVAPGELLCLLGPSGCGKSTLLRVIAGLAEVDAGQVAIAGHDVTHAAANRRPTAMVFQSHALWPHMTVARNIGFGLRVRRIPKDEQRRRIAEVLELVGLSGFETRYPGEMSGGQAQRVALARCLVVEPRILLMDEPFSALDAHLRQRLREDLKALQRRLKLTTVFVTHDQEEAMQIADRIAVMGAGVIDQVASPGQLYLCPETLHVARFIGEMNETPMAIRNNVAEWHGAKMEMDAEDGDYLALCRPEELAPQSHGAAFSVESSSDLGASLRLQVKAEDGSVLRWSVMRQAAAPSGAKVALWPQRLLLYRGGKLAAVTKPWLSRSPALHMISSGA